MTFVLFNGKITFMTMSYPNECYIIFIANKILAGKAIQYNTTLQNIYTTVHEQHKEMSYS
jgi:hypothetical protein